MNVPAPGQSLLPFAIRVVAIAVALGVALPDPADARPKQSRSKSTAPSSATSSSNQWRSGYAAIVVDANTGKVLHESEPDALRHPASVTKVMTLYMLFEQLEAGRLKLDSQLPVSPRAAAQDPTKLGLRPGSTIEVEDAIRALVTKSANDAAVVIAEAIGGDEASFAAMMTRKARALGMSRTTFRNASGLPNPDQVTTARDLSLLGRAIQERFPRYYRYFSTRQFAWRGNSIANHNKLLGRVEGVDGIKTGYTRASGFNLLTSAKRGGRHVVGVVLGGRTGARGRGLRPRLYQHRLRRHRRGEALQRRERNHRLALRPLHEPHDQGGKYPQLPVSNGRRQRAGGV
ncbi:MAG: D-alanyl-D-alanine carboxypeptidase [Methylacidiphilales bacterium]|nr:D-alanyl-D-alanine carboxypeptidase [Candidatus Methylacidiphilales bacterium]